MKHKESFMAMRFRFQSLLSTLLLPILAVLMIAPPDMLAQDHVATANDLRNELRNASQERQDHIAKLQHFLSSDVAQKALRSAKLDPAKAQAAIPLLSDQELARLAAQVDRADFAGAGLSLTNEQVTIILIGIVIIIVVAILASR
jgi:hypothetical protein